MANSVGRPTKYREEYCEKLIEHMARGRSIESFAGVVSVCKDTIYEWIKVHPKFSDAFKVGNQKRFLYFEELGLDNMISTSTTDKQGNNTYTESKSLNAAVYKLFMANLFGFTDKVEQKTETTHKLDGITAEEREAAVKKLASISDRLNE